MINISRVNSLKAIIFTLSLSFATSMVSSGGDGNGSFGDFLSDNSAEAAREKAATSREEKSKRFGCKNKNELKSHIRASASASNPRLSNMDYESYANKLAKTLDMLSTEQQNRIFR